MDLVVGLKHNEGRRSHLHLNGTLSEYVSFWLSHGRTFTAASESRQKHRMLSCCVRAGGAGRRPAGVCSALNSPFTCGALSPWDTVVYTLNAKARLWTLSHKCCLLITASYGTQQSISRVFEGSESSIQISRCLLSYWRHMYTRKYILLLLILQID